MFNKFNIIYYVVQFSCLILVEYAAVHLAEQGKWPMAMLSCLSSILVMICIAVSYVCDQIRDLRQIILKSELISYAAKIKQVRDEREKLRNYYRVGK